MVIRKQMKMDNKGFTIIELMIAISILSVIMLISSTAIIFIARQYQNGVTRTTLQSASRQLHQKFIDSIKFSGGEIISQPEVSGGYSVICVGDTRYYFKKPPTTSITTTTGMSNLFFDKNATGFSNITCGAGLNESSSAKLLPNNSRVAQASLICDTSSPKSCTLKTTFISGDDDLFNTNTRPDIDNLRCKTGIGNQWCSIVNLSSTVNSKI